MKSDSRSKSTNNKVSKREPIEFRLGKLEFKTVNYDAESISSSETQFSGKGRVNGKLGFNFTLTVSDSQAPDAGGLDKVRLKIWNEQTGDVVFDSELGPNGTVEPTPSGKRGSGVPR